MNRADFSELQKEVINEINMPGGVFENAFGNSEEIKKQAEFIAGVALFAVDRYYSRLTKTEFEIRVNEENHEGG